MILVSVRSLTGPAIVGAQHAAPLRRRLLGATVLAVAACSSGTSAAHHAAVAAVAASPRPVVLRVGQAAQLIAVPLDAPGVPLARTVTWASPDSGVGTVS